MRVGRIVLMAAVAAMAFTTTAEAGSIVDCPNPIGSYGRQISMTNVLSPCYYTAPASGTPQASDITTYFGGTWLNEGALAANGTNDLLTITANGAWDNDVTGTWAIDPSFWATWGRAVISVHVGAGPPTSLVSNPDWFFFEVVNGAVSGNFSYKVYAGSGGGLSNFFLWGNGLPQGCETEPCAPSTVPEPATLLLFGTGLVALAAKLRRRQTRG